jgi:hypothetical protein
MLKKRTSEIVLGFLTATVFWTGVLGWQSSYQPTEIEKQECQAAAKKAGHKTEECKSLWEKTSTDPVAFFTFVLSISTIGLWVATGIGIRNQSRDTEIIQRAYLSVEPVGIEPFRTDYSTGEHRIACHIRIFNSGNLPAQNVSWILRRKFSRDAHLNDFPIFGKFRFNNVLVQRAKMQKGALPLTTTRYKRYRKGGTGNDRWLYVWGRVNYTDGFGKPRFTDFCHRYNMAASGPGYTISGEYARYHEYGNATDETA